jgi:hypothetical protein
MAGRQAVVGEVARVIQGLIAIREQHYLRAQAGS